MRPLRIGIDSYSYHRLLGDVRPGEDPPPRQFDTREVLDHALSLGVDAVSLETSFLELPLPPIDLEPVLAWGHPDGLAVEGGLDDLLAWIDVAAAIGCELVRCVAGSPRVRCKPTDDLRAAAARAQKRGITLALENHADLRAAEIAELVERVDGLAVCFDTANALRVGDDPLEAARLLAPWTRLVHLKDVAAGWTDPVAGP